MGKWYFEFEVLTAGNMRVGWAQPGCSPDKELGSDDQAYVFDGFEVRQSNLTTFDIPIDPCLRKQKFCVVLVKKTYYLMHLL